MTKKVVNLDEFFSTTNEREGVWHEPVIDGVPCGFELLLVGINSDENAISAERYEKELVEAEKINNAIDKAEKIRHIEAKRFAFFVRGIRATNGGEIRIGGKPIEYSTNLIEKLLYESLPLQLDIAEFVRKSANFMNGKKN